jgi:tetratricopeptide (TPR) repeat protein
MKRYIVSGLCVLAAYLAILGPFTREMAEKPYAVKLGMIPHPTVLQVLFPDYQEFLAANILGRVFLYYGTLAGEVANPGKVQLAADYPAMSRAVHAALHLDPYNMDGYYFGQSILVWDVGQYKLATELLEYGMQYRTWDWQLPFFAAFNEAYFLKDHAAAARLYMRAGELSDSTLFKSLAGRYLQEAGETQMAIDYLQTLEKNARNPAVKQTLQVRIETFKAVLTIEKARDRYAEEQGRVPANIDVLVKTGYLTTRPIDLYGGEFYLDENGQVHTTSKFAFAAPNRSVEDETPEPPSDK